MLGLHFTPACVLPSVCSLHFTLSLHFTPGPQSAVRSPQSVFYTDQIIFSCWSHKEELHYGISKLGNKIAKVNKITIFKKHKSHDCFSMKNKWCRVRMLSPNKSCSKDNLDQVIDVQQYNPLIHQQLRESKIQAVMHIIICYNWRATRQILTVVSSCCATQRETKWQAPERGAKKYGPATIREAQQCLKFLAYYALTQKHFEAGTKHEQQAAIFKTEDRSSGKKSFKTTIFWRKSHISVVK